MSTRIHIAAGVIHPDSMKRKDMIRMISSFSSHAEASGWWLRYASHRVSKAAFNKARGI